MRPEDIRVGMRFRHSTDSNMVIEITDTKEKICKIERNGNTLRYHAATIIKHGSLLVKKTGLLNYILL